VDFDTTVKLRIYQTIAETTKAPSSGDLARMLGVSKEQVDDAYQRLHAKRLLVPEPHDASRIRMAPPFSGIPTSFRVEIEGKDYFANCIWDGLGVAAALQKDAIVNATDGYTNEPILLEVRNGAVVPQECAVHFAVPAALWWKDVIYT
jgi:DNA-binding transcriptional MocR family regulator